MRKFIREYRTKVKTYKIGDVVEFQDADLIEKLEKNKTIRVVKKDEKEFYKKIMMSGSNEENKKLKEEVESLKEEIVDLKTGDLAKKLDYKTGIIKELLNAMNLKDIEKYVLQKDIKLNGTTKDEKIGEILKLFEV